MSTPAHLRNRPMHGDIWEHVYSRVRFSVMHVCGRHEPPVVTGYWHGEDGILDPDRHGSIPLPRFQERFALCEREEYTLAYDKHEYHDEGSLTVVCEKCGNEFQASCTGFVVCADCLNNRRP